MELRRLNYCQREKELAGSRFEIGLNSLSPLCIVLKLYRKFIMRACDFGQLLNTREGIYVGRQLILCVYWLISVEKTTNIAWYFRPIQHDLHMYWIDFNGRGFLFKFYGFSFSFSMDDLDQLAWMAMKSILFDEHSFSGFYLKIIESIWLELLFNLDPKHLIEWN